MIAACPTCGARYRIDTAKLRPEGARLRCSRCESVFRVRAPAPAAAPASEGPAPTAGPSSEAPAAAAARSSEAPAAPSRPASAEPPGSQAGAAGAERPTRRAPAPGAPVERSFDRERLVLVAHPETESGKAIADALGDWGLQTLLVHDGVEAILNIQRTLPRVVVLDAALPKMFGFQVCELMKRNESLRDIRVVLVGAIHAQDRYRRPPGDLYGADEYVERHQLPEALAPLLQRFGLPVSGVAASAVPTGAPKPARPAPPAPSAPAAAAPAPAAEPEPPVAPPQPAPAPAPATAAPPSPPAAEAPGADPALADEVAQADRLARIIVSDIVLYNPERFEEGLRSGNVVQALEAELEEGRTLLAQRVDPRVGAPEEFLHRELLRVARARGAGK